MTTGWVNQRRERDAAPAVAVALWIVAALPGATSAQTVHGRLLERETARPISSGLVVLLDEASEEVDRAETDSLGHFTLESPEPGAFYIRAERIGYRTKTDGILEIGEGGKITIAFYLRPEPVEIEGVEATGERTDWIETNQRRFLEGQGFYRRKRAGFGHFVTPEEIEEDPPWGPRDLFKKIPGMAIGVGAGVGRQVVRLDCTRGIGSGDFAVWVDGMRVFQGTEWEPTNDVDIEAIAAIEVYTRLSSLPLQYTISGICGGILVWTK